MEEVSLFCSNLDLTQPLTRPVGNRGLGAKIAEKFASEGANVVINYSANETAASELAARLKSEYGVQTHIVQGDAGVTADIKYLVHETIKTLGGIDVIIGNAVSLRRERQRRRGFFPLL
jgi:NAD(P)-dependent dehydrogenase (short-subunit alcohol dehydrogenase family)